MGFATHIITTWHFTKLICELLSRRGEPGLLVAVVCECDFPQRSSPGDKIPCALPEQPLHVSVAPHKRAQRAPRSSQQDLESPFAFSAKGKKMCCKPRMKPRGIFFPPRLEATHPCCSFSFSFAYAERPHPSFFLKGVKREWWLARDHRSCGNCQLSTGPTKSLQQWHRALLLCHRGGWDQRHEVPRYNCKINTVFFLDWSICSLQEKGRFWSVMSWFIEIKSLEVCHKCRIRGLKGVLEARHSKKALSTAMSGHRSCIALNTSFQYLPLKVQTYFQFFTTFFPKFSAILTLSECNEEA